MSRGIMSGITVESDEAIDHSPDLEVPGTFAGDGMRDPASFFRHDKRARGGSEGVRARRRDDGPVASLDHAVAQGFLRPEVRARLLVAPDAEALLTAWT